MLIDTKADVKSDLQGKNFNFELNGKTFKALFSDIYTDKIGSVVREIASNCRDSHVEAGKADVPFDIKIGSDGFGSNIIEFTDYGVGMSKRDIKKGEIITEKDIHLLSPGDGFKWIEKSSVIGKEAAMDIPKDEIIYSKCLK